MAQACYTTRVAVWASLILEDDMTAQVRGGRPFKDVQFDGDAGGAGTNRADCQLWDRIAEGNMIWDRTAPRVHTRAALTIMTRQGQRDGLPR